MAVLASIGVEVTTAAALAGIVGTLPVEVTVGNADAEIQITIDHAAQLAAAASFQRVGVRIDVDLGAGMETIADSEIGIDVTIAESLDQYADQLTFSLVGEKYSPFSRSITRAKRAVAVAVVYGAPGAEFLAYVFRGFITAATFNAQPPIATITALDSASLYSTRKAKEYSVQPNSDRERLSILHDLLSITAIPIRELDIVPGKVSKPVTPGDTEILSFLRDWLSPTGVTIGFENGGFVARRYRASDPVTAELTPRDICSPFTMTPPATMTATVVTVVAVKFETISDDGLRTEIEEVVTTGPYSPAQWVDLQLADGTIIHNGAGLPPADVRVISRIVTATTYLGATPMRIEQTEFGWYAPKAARLQINDDVDNTITPFGNHWLFPDGSWRSEPAESFRRIRKNITNKELDDAQNVVKTTEERYFFHFLRKAIFQVAGGPPLDVVIATTPIVEDGGGVLFDHEYMGLLIGDDGNTVEGNLAASTITVRPDSYTITELTLDDDGAIKSSTITEHYFDIGQPRGKSQVGSYGYGIDNRVYTNRPSEGSIGTADTYGGLKVTRTSYRTLDETRFETTTQTSVQGGVPTTVVQTGSGSRPRPERVMPKSASQEISATMTDALRLAMNGYIQDAIHNEYIENSDEARVVAVKELRERSAIVFTFDMPIEGLIHKWKTITLDYPLVSVAGLRLYVRQITRNFSRFRQTVVAVWYPPEIR